MERRQFLMGCSVAAVVTATEQPRAVLNLLDRAPLVDGSAGRSAFEPLLGHAFRVYDDQGRFRDRLRLAAIENSPYCCDALDQFSLLWEGLDGVTLPEDIYYLTNQCTSALRVRIIAAADSRPARYRSLFSLFKTASV